MTSLGGILNFYELLPKGETFAMAKNLKNIYNVKSNKKF
jgi:hypothetical protein